MAYSVLRSLTVFTVHSAPGNDFLRGISIADCLHTNMHLAEKNLFGKIVAAIAPPKRVKPVLFD